MLTRANIRRFARLLALSLLVAGPAVGRQLLAQEPDRTHPGEYDQADIIYGSRVYASQCTTCHGATGEGVGSVNLRSGQFRRASTDRELMQVITTGIPGTGMPPNRLDTAELAGIVAYLRNMSTFEVEKVEVGDLGRGKALFEGKAECTKCHRVGDRGSRVAPDLSDIGAARRPSALQRHLIDPSSVMFPINRPVRLVTRGGKTITGRRLNEDTYTIQLFDGEERLVSVLKDDLREYTILDTSPMPSYKDKLTPLERADVIAYLLSLKGK